MQAMLCEMAQAAIYQSSKPRQKAPFEIHTETDASRAQRLAYTPLTIFVENDISDGALLEFAVEKLGSRRLRELWLGFGAELRPKAIRLDSRGGHGQVIPFVTRTVGEALAATLPTRLFVVVDSDGERSGEIKPHAAKIQAYCDGQGVPCHVLRKRTAENYLPDAAWIRELGDDQEPIPTLRRLSNEQRDYLDMKEANKPPWLLSKPQPSASDRTRRLGKQKRWSAAKRQPPALYAGLGKDSEPYKTLRGADLKGQGTGRAILWLKKHREAITAADLGRRDGEGELKGLLAAIEQEL